MNAKGRVIILILSLAIAATVALRSFDWWRQTPIQHAANGIVIVPGAVDSGYIAAQPLSQTPANTAAAITEAGDAGSNARSALPDPTVEAMLERGAQDDRSASHHRMLERQELVPGGGTPSASDAPGSTP